jgi:hypothetical protein
MKTIVGYENNAAVTVYPESWQKTTNWGHFGRVLLMVVQIPVAQVTNIFSYSRRYIKYAVIHLEGNANLVNRFLFIESNLR